MASPIKVVNVQVDVAVTPALVTYSGDCDASGKVAVNVREAPTDVWITLSTINAAGNPPASATVTDLSWPQGQPAWINSVGQPRLPASQNNLVWILTSTSNTPGEQVSFNLDLEYQGSPIPVDPTIINVDGDQLMPDRQPGSGKGRENSPPAQRTDPAAPGF